MSCAEVRSDGQITLKIYFYSIEKKTKFELWQNELIILCILSGKCSLTCAKSNNGERTVVPYLIRDKFITENVIPGRQLLILKHIFHGIPLSGTHKLHNERVNTQFYESRITSKSRNWLIKFLITLGNNGMFNNFSYFISKHEIYMTFMKYGFGIP